MLLTIDIGNTNIVFGLFTGNTLKNVMRMESLPNISVREYAVRIKKLLGSQSHSSDDLQGVILASVVPELTWIFQKVFKQYFSVPFIKVGLHLKTGLKVRIDNPDELGADRLVNAVAAYTQYKTSLIVVDFGTATTFDCIAKGAYIGGIIAPGPVLSAHALADHTALLPFVKLQRPKKVIGKNTVACIESGLYYGYTGLIKEILRTIKKEMGRKVTVIATGGFSDFWTKKISAIEYVVPHLTLKGLKILWELNHEH